MLKLNLVDELIEVEDDMTSENEFLKLVSPNKNFEGSLCLFGDYLEDINETNSKIFPKIFHQ
jgi:hypothetical protein